MSRRSGAWGGLAALTLGAWMVWGYVVFNRPPTDLASRVMFLGVLFVALTGTLAFPAHVVGRGLHGRWPAIHSGGLVAVRQGALLALLIVVCAMLHLARALTLGHAGLILGTLLIVEIFWQVRRD